MYSQAGSSYSLNDGKEGAGEEDIKHVQNECLYFFIGLRLPLCSLFKYSCINYFVL